MADINNEIKQIEPVQSKEDFLIKQNHDIQERVKLIKNPSHTPILYENKTNIELSPQTPTTSDKKTLNIGKNVQLPVGILKYQQMQNKPKQYSINKLNYIQDPEIKNELYQSQGYVRQQEEHVTFKTISDILDNTYNYEETISSTALDILAVYLKGQKILYIEAKTFCEQRLNCLMLPAIFVSAVCAVLSLELKTYEYGAIIIAALNGLNSFILSLISYLKLDAKAEAHKASSYKFDKLQSLCEFNSGKILFFNNDPKAILKILNEIETIVKEIKETNQFILPETIRYRYQKLYSTNIFSLVKKIQNEEIVLVNDLKTTINKIIDLTNGEITDDVKEQLIELNREQDEQLENIIKFRNKYLEIDKTFNDEIDENISNSKYNFNLCGCVNT
jgi:hypothetical protein